MGKKLVIHHHKDGTTHRQRAPKKRKPESVVSDVLKNYGTKKKSVVTDVLKNFGA